jgi:rifamycin polyketide synthase module 1/2/3
VARLREQLAAHGGGTAATVEFCAEDDREAILRLVHADPRRPLTAIVHAADVSHTGRLADLTAAEVADVYRAKVDTALWLAGEFADASLEAFVIYSSIAGIWGGGGQGLGGAANSLLDALAGRLRAAGLPATSIAWGALTEPGVGLDEAALSALRRRGLLPMTPAEAMAALAQAVAAEESAVTVAGMDWAAFLPAFLSVRPSPLLADLPEAEAAGRGAPAEDSGETTSELVASLRPVPEAEQERILVRLVRGHASTVLGHSGVDGVGPAQAFQEAGFDSLAAVSLRNSLIAATGLALSATLVFDYPNPQALAGHLRTELLRADDEFAGREPELRRLLATVPFDRFRDAGILTTLLGLTEDADPAARGSADAPAPGEDLLTTVEDDIDALDLESLVQRALGEAG